MPQSGMKAPAAAKKDTHKQGAPETRRSRFSFDRFHRTSPPPCKANPTENHVRASLRGRSGHAKAEPPAGRSSALAPDRALTSVYAKTLAIPLTATKDFSYNTHPKSDTASGPLARRARRFSGWFRCLLGEPLT